MNIFGGFYIGCLFYLFNQKWIISCFLPRFLFQIWFSKFSTKNSNFPHEIRNDEAALACFKTFDTDGWDKKLLPTFSSFSRSSCSHHKLIILLEIIIVMIWLIFWWFIIIDDCHWRDSVPKVGRLTSFPQRHWVTDTLFLTHPQHCQYMSIKLYGDNN